VNDNSPTGPKLKERVDLGVLLQRGQDRLRSAYPPPPLTLLERLNAVKGQHDWMDVIFMVIMVCWMICSVAITIGVVVLAINKVGL